jgi:hypothetical protein
MSIPLRSDLNETGQNQGEDIFEKMKLIVEEIKILTRKE